MHLVRHQHSSARHDDRRSPSRFPQVGKAVVFRGGNPNSPPPFPRTPQDFPELRCHATEPSPERCAHTTSRHITSRCAPPNRPATSRRAAPGLSVVARANVAPQKTVTEFPATSSCHPRAFQTASQETHPPARDPIVSLHP